MIACNGVGKIIYCGSSICFMFLFGNLCTPSVHPGVGLTVGLDDRLGGRACEISRSLQPLYSGKTTSIMGDLITRRMKNNANNTIAGGM